MSLKGAQCYTDVKYLNTSQHKFKERNMFQA